MKYFLRSIKQPLRILILLTSVFLLDPTLTHSAVDSTTQWTAKRGGSWLFTGTSVQLTKPATRTTDNANLALFNEAANEQFKISTQAKTVATPSLWNDFSIVFGFKDVNNYYYVSFNEHNNPKTNGIFQVHNGQLRQLVDMKRTIQANRYYQVTVDYDGTQLKVRRNGQPVASLNNVHLPTSQVGVGSRNDAVRFNQFQLTNIPIVINPEAGADTNASTSDSTGSSDTTTTETTDCVDTTDTDTTTNPDTTTDTPLSAIDLTNWKLTLPTGLIEDPTSINYPDVLLYQNDPFFKNDPVGLRFRAPINGVTTIGSNYPRSELREMTNGGLDEASWDTTTGQHSMYIKEAITALPVTKDQLVAGQIHDALSDVMVVRLQKNSLFLKIGSMMGPILDADYQLGRVFSVKFVAGNGQIQVYYNDAPNPVYTLPLVSTGLYFKAGAYTQSNCTWETVLNCNKNNYGEVEIYQLTLE